MADTELAFDGDDAASSRKSKPTPTTIASRQPASSSPDTAPVADTTYQSTTKSKRTPMAAGGAFIRNIIKKGGKNGGPLRIEDLDETVLQKRLSKLDEELNEYKQKCAKYKKENDWYRDEIETCKRDTAEYISYLESKKSEKLEAIHRLTESNQKDMEMFMIKRKKREEENEDRIKELKDAIMDYEMKLAAKESEIMQLSDIMTRREKHETEMNKIRKEMQASQEEHRSKMNELEHSLLETRMRLQKEADAKIKSMESAAHEKAAKYLADHTAALEAENRKLERDLRKMTVYTQQQIQYRDRLELENRELQREHKLRSDLARMRLKKIHEVQSDAVDTKESRRRMMAHQNKAIVTHALESHGLSSLGRPSRRVLAAEALVHPNRSMSRGAGSIDIQRRESFNPGASFMNRSSMRDLDASGSHQFSFSLSRSGANALMGSSAGVGKSMQTGKSGVKVAPQDNKETLLALQQHDDMWFEDDADDEYR